MVFARYSRRVIAPYFVVGKFCHEAPSQGLWRRVGLASDWRRVRAWISAGNGVLQLRLNRRWLAVRAFVRRISRAIGVGMVWVWVWVCVPVVGMGMTCGWWCVVCACAFGCGRQSVGSVIGVSFA